MSPRSLFAVLMLACLGGRGAVAETGPARGVFCSALDQALAAAAEPTPFESVRINSASNPNRSRLNIAGINHCSAGRFGSREAATYALWCHQNLAPPELTVENLTADTARCLDRTPVRGRYGEQLFDLGRVVIRIDGHCTDRCHVGRSIEYRIEVRAP